jgi:uncharacterized membrane protein
MQPGLETDRIETLADGVFAIAMTLLVFAITVPELAPHALDQLTQKLLDLWPKLLAYAISFVVLGIFWIGHHAQFAFIRRADRTFLWLNILFLMFVAFVPFSAALLGRYPTQHPAVVVYGTNLIVAGLALYLVWWYATHRRRLVDPELDQARIRIATRRILMGPVAYAIAVGISLLSIPLAIVILALVPWLYIVPSRIDRYWSPRRVRGVESHR